MTRNTEDQNMKNQYSDKQKDSDSSGSKGGASQKDYQDTADSRSRDHFNRNRDEELQEESSSW